MMILPVLLQLSGPARMKPQAEPPNRPARAAVTADHVALRYADGLILDARIASTGGALDLRQAVDTAGGRVTQVIKWTAAGGGRVTVTGTIAASAEAFTAEVEPRKDGLPIVRHQVGPAKNRLHRSVYDRRSDWVISVDFPAHVEIAAIDSQPGATRFAFSATGGEVALRFRPRFYQRHRGLEQYRPWTYQPWTGSVAGWTSWYAFSDRVTEADIRRTADVMGEVLRPAGYRYLQIDDGYQRLPIGVSSHWLQTNEKFPSGLANLRRYIADRGLDAGIWTNVSFQDREQALAHPRWFVRDRNDRPAFGNWVGYVMDGSEPSTITDLVRPVYRELKRMGWTYFKLDALRHLRYEGYNSFREYFDRKGIDREQVYRGFVQAVRDLIGRDVYLLACWGIRPELIGLVDGVRVGDDGFGYGSFAQYNSFNNVVWRNDPDHIELRRADGYRAATITSLTGSALMLTDPPEIYRTERVEGARRTAPVLFTRPGQLYDVDPSRSSRLYEARTEVSGAGPRPFDADQRLVVPLYQLDVARPFEQWTVLANTGTAPSSVRLADLGLADSTEYVAFDFWAGRSLGVIRDSLALGAVDPRFQIQVVCVRLRLPRPQVLATSRHVTCGGPDLVQLGWADRTLSGASDLVPGDRYAIYLSEPPGFRLEQAEADGARIGENTLLEATRTIRLESERGGRVAWRLRYVEAPR